jgi:cell wall-associated NlpC family hydrolase
MMGVHIPRTASQQATITNGTRFTSVDKLTPGALVFWKLDAETKDKLASHVGIYSGNGNVIHCGSSGCVEVPMFKKERFVLGIALDPATWGDGASETVEYNNNLAMLSDYNSEEYKKNPSVTLGSIWSKYSASGSGIRPSNRRAANNAAISKAISASGSKIISGSRPSMNDVMSGGIKFGNDSISNNTRGRKIVHSTGLYGAADNRPSIKGARRSGGASGTSTNAVDKELLNTIILLLGNIADNTSSVKDLVTLLSDIVNSKPTSKSTPAKSATSKNLGSILSKHANSDRTDVSALMADLRSIVSNA